MGKIKWALEVISLSFAIVFGAAIYFVYNFCSNRWGIKGVVIVICVMATFSFYYRFRESVIDTVKNNIGGD